MATKAAKVSAPEFVTAVSPRTCEWTSRHVFLPHAELSALVGVSQDTLVNFSVHRAQHQEAKTLALTLWQALQAGRRAEAKQLYAQLAPLRQLREHERTDLQKWAHTAIQLPTDIGGPHKRAVRAVLSPLCRGRILEAMCGFNSYLEPDEQRSVTALDYCREALERYPYPERPRILFDLNTVTHERGLGFFSERQFDVILICYGFNYLHRPVPVYREFNRILGTTGKLLFVENPHQGYWDIAKRRFSPQACRQQLRAAGFTQILVDELPIGTKEEKEWGSRYYLTQAFRS